MSLHQKSMESFSLPSVRLDAGKNFTGYFFRCSPQVRAETEPRSFQSCDVGIDTAATLL